MLLKDKLGRFFSRDKKYSDPIKTPVMDGFVDIKGYRISEDGKRTLVYHDCGDNVVTDWMRHAIMVMLTGSVFSANGRDSLDTATAQVSRGSSASFTMPGQSLQYHQAKSTDHPFGKNLDGYLLNGKQYFYNAGVKSSPDQDLTEKYSQSTMADNKYAYFPTKILFGTGKEYSSWEILQTENEAANATWYTEMLNSYGGDLSTAKANFDTNIDITCNTYSGSISKNIYTGNGAITKNRTVNDPDSSSSIISTTSTMNKNYGVVGAIKTIYFDEENDSAYLQSTLSDSGKLLKPVNRGVGRPCFIYLNTPQITVGGKRTPKEGWADSSAEAALSKDSSASYLNKLTFTVTMPAQTAADNAVGQYYPYNGYTLKQMGLFNDARLTTGTDSSQDLNSYPYNNMPCGMLLAIKNITAFEKTADSEVVITWTLTI